MTKISATWNKIFNELNILPEIEKYGFFKISSKEINEYKESRLMTKFDHSYNLPKIFIKNKLSILPISRGEYIIGRFEAYFPIKYDNSIKPIKVELPEIVQSIDINKIFSETVCINAAYVSGVISRLLGENSFPTLSGRMTTKSFEYYINDINMPNKAKIEVNNSQIEIDACFESENYVVLIEAKNYSVDDFLIRQLYYPYRLLASKTNKKIFPVFMTYSLDVFSLFVFEFPEIENYNSIEMKKQINFTFSSPDFNLEEIQKILNEANVLRQSNITFPQADNFTKVIDLLNLMQSNELTFEEIKTQYSFVMRQAHYYLDACRYLGLVEESSSSGKRKFTLNKTGLQIMALPYKQKYTEIIKIILSNEVFNEYFKLYLKYAKPPDKKEVILLMEKSLRYNPTTLKRRASSLKSWTDWILGLIIED